MITGLLALPELSTVSSFTHIWGVPIHPALGITDPLLFVNSTADLGFYTVLPHLQWSVINMEALSHVSSITLREEGLLDLCDLEFGSGTSQLWRPCLSALATGHCSIFSTNQPLCSLISDSEADTTAVYLCLQSLVIYFILSGRMLSSKLLQTL